ncbi:MAG TPA: hypothetical protein VHU91_02790 [Mycobacteriales bacterium]|nr:hypothetical protein [Mycobacteriales bacterium]
MSTGETSRSRRSLPPSALRLPADGFSSRTARALAVLTYLRGA